jgi:hypothetical protein
MTTQISKKSLQAKLDALAEKMTQVAREAQPRPGFFVEPILRVWEPEDPEGELPAHEVFGFVVDGAEDELAAFHRVVRSAMAESIRKDPSLGLRITLETIFPRETRAFQR